MNLNLHLNEKQVLIDKIKLSNVEISSIFDPQKLEDKGCLHREEAGMRYAASKNGVDFSRVNVKDEQVRLFAGVDNLHRRKYCKMELNVSGKEHGNLYCDDMAGLWDRIISAQGHLLKNYEIETDVEDAKITYIELNKTFKVSGDFDAYKRPLALLMSFLPVNMGVQGDFRTNNGAYQLTEKFSGNKSRSLKVYDKSSQVKINIEGSVIRVELTLKKPETIKQALGSNRLDQLTDEVVNNYFNTQMKKLFSDPLKKWQEEKEKRLLHLMEQKKEEEHHWIGAVLGTLQDQEVLSGVPEVMDVHDLFPLVDRMQAAKKARTKRMLMEQAEKVQTALNRRDDLRLKELIGKLTDTPNEQLKWTLRTDRMPGSVPMEKRKIA